MTKIDFQHYQIKQITQKQVSARTNFFESLLKQENKLDPSSLAKQSGIQAEDNFEITSKYLFYK